MEIRHHHHHHLHHALQLTDLGPEAGHLVLQLPHPVRLCDRGAEVVLGGDLLVLTFRNTISVSSVRYHDIWDKVDTEIKTIK